MLRSNYESLDSGHTSLQTSDHLCNSDTPPLDRVVASPAEGQTPDFAALFSTDLTPNKRAVMEAMLTHWIANPPSHRALRAGAAAHSICSSSPYPVSVKTQASPSLHPTERHAS